MRIARVSPAAAGRANKCPSATNQSPAPGLQIRYRRVNNKYPLYHAPNPGLVKLRRNP